MSAIKNPIFIVAAIVVSNIASHFLEESASSLNQQVWIEWLAWVIFVVLTHLLPSSDAPEDGMLSQEKHSRNGPQTWKFDSLLATTATLYVLGRCIVLFSTTTPLQWALSLVPVLTFVIAPSVQDLTSSGTSPRSVLDQVQLWRDALVTVLGRDSGASLPLVVFAAISAASAVLCLVNTAPSTLGCMLQGMVYACLTSGFYILMSLRAPMQSQLGESRSNLHGPILRAFSIYACVIYSTIIVLYLALSSETLADGFVTLSASFGRACLRSIQLFSITSLCLEGLSFTASTIGPVSLALIQSSSVAQTSTAFLFSCTAAGTLAQTLGTLPKSLVKRYGLLSLFGLPIVALFVRLVATTSLPQKSPGYDLGGTNHPIAQLFEAKNAQFQSMLAEQSTTLEQAVTRYQSRHHRAPPPGFDKWFEIAQSLNFGFIDEFDEAMASLEPFWGIAPTTIQARLKSIEHANNIIKVTVNASGTYMPNGGDWHLPELQKWLDRSTWGSVVPETSFYISDIDEPRVVAPYDTVDLAITAAQRGLPHTSASSDKPFHVAGSDTVKWINIGKQDAWEAFFSSCSIDSPARNEQSRNNISSEYPPFVANVSTSRNVCLSPTLKGNHAFFLAPESLLITRTLVPVFSQTKPTIFNDILYPSPYYAGQMEGEGPETKKEPDWEDKLDRLYWAGGSTGGRNTIDNWRKMLRNRMTLLTSADSTVPVRLLQKGLNNVWRPIQSTWSSISDLFYMRITNIVQCEDDACEVMKEKFQPKGEPGDKPFENKYVLDMDGNSFSGRFYRLLRSKSCVLKQGIFTEWHDGRLIPWVHFIPVSPEGEELGEIIRYLTSDEEGKRIGKAIAEQGREWSRKTLRYRDLEIAFVRILLEYNRLLEPDRDNLSWNTPR